MDLVSDAAHAAVSTDKCMLHSEVDLGSGKRRRKRSSSRSGKGPDVGINQADLDLDHSVHPTCIEAEGRIQGNIVDVDSTAVLNAECSSNIFSTTHPLEKSQKAVQSGKERSKRLVINRADSGPSEIVSPGVTYGANLGFYPHPLSSAVSSKSHRYLNGMIGPSEVKHREQLMLKHREQLMLKQREQLMLWNVPYGANSYFAPRPNVWRRSQQHVNGIGPSQPMYPDVPNGESSCFVPHPFVPSVSGRSEQHVHGMAGSFQHVNGMACPSQRMYQDVSYGENSCFIPRPFIPSVPSQFMYWDGENSCFVPHPIVPSVGGRRKLHVNGMEDPSQVMYWDVPYGENSCFVPLSIVSSVSGRSEQPVKGLEGPSQDASYGANFIPHPIAPVVGSRRKLLVLDVNGLLADIIKPAPKDWRPDAKILGRAIFKRPFYYEFLEFCFEKFDVGIWSSRSKEVLDKIVAYLLGDLQTKLLFCWNMRHCTQTKFKAPKEGYKPMVLKELSKLWEQADPNLPWERGYYNESNTVLLDDSPYKALLNPINTAIFPHSFTYKARHNTSLGPGGTLRVYLENLAEADDAREFIAQHPFGQPAIDSSSPIWAFYSEVLHSFSEMLKNASVSS